MHLASTLTRQGRRLGAALGLAALLAAPPAAAQDNEALLELARSAYFHVEVSGTPRLKDHPLHAAKRSGKAFAVGPNLLVTARHVLGDADEWQLATITDPLLARAIEPLERRITLRNRDGANRSDTAVVEGATSPTLNAAGLRLTDQLVEQHFALSFCPIRPEGHYRVLLPGGPDPSDVRSVDAPMIFRVRAGADASSELAGLFVFGIEGGNPPPVVDWGYDGAPILDVENNVVAIVSAYTTLDGVPKLLATPVQPLIPGSLRQLAQEPDVKPAKVLHRRCSMADTVKRIHDQLNAHSVWNVTVDKYLDPAQGTMRPSGDILIEYENVADQPNVKELVVVYDVRGKRSADRDDLGSIPPPADVQVRDEDDYYEEQYEIHLPAEPNKRKFVLENVDELIEKYENQLSGGRRPGYIQELVLYIYPFFDGKTEPELRPITRRIPYVELR